MISSPRVRIGDIAPVVVDYAGLDAVDRAAESARADMARFDVIGEVRVPSPSFPRAR